MKVRCRDCGLLSMRGRMSGNMLIVDENTRNTGTHREFTTTPWIANICCAFGERQFDPYEQATADSVVSQLQSEIDCEEFIIFRPGLSAEAHLKMNTLEIMRKESSETIAQCQAIASGIAYDNQRMFERHHAEWMDHNHKMLTIKSEIKDMIEDHRRQDKIGDQLERDADKKFAANLRSSDLSKAERWRS